MRSNVEELARIVIDCGYRLHQNLGPGLLESAYEAILTDQLIRRGIFVERQKPIPIRYDGLELAEGFRADLMLGLLINFGGATFKEGVRRIANGDLAR